MIPLEWIQEAGQRIKPYVRLTPLVYDPELDIYIKWENQQTTGSFKLRGAINKVLTLQSWERERGLVAASAGNHGQGLALAGQFVGASVTIFASEHAVPQKIAAMQELGAIVKLIPGGYADAEQAAIAYAQLNGSTWVSPYNDGQVIAGQATLAFEILSELPPLQHSTWLTPVGGGGLAAGLLTVLASLHPRPPLVGVQSTASPFFHALFHRGTQSDVIELPSLADGLSGPVEEGSVTIPILHAGLDDLILVTEEEIGRAVAFAWTKYGQRIEGSAAVSLAAVLSGKIIDRPTVLIISGGNIQAEVHEQLVEQYGFTDHS